jgi:hypothetical protein
MQSERRPSEKSYQHHYRMTQARAARRCYNSGGKNVAAALGEAPQGEATGDLRTVTRAAADDEKRRPSPGPRRAHCGLVRPNV